VFFERDDLSCSAPSGKLSQIKKADLNEERGLVPVDVLVRESSAPPWSVPPKVLEPVGSHFGVSDRVLDVLVPEVVLQGARVVAIIGQLEAAGVAKHVRVDREWHLGGLPDTLDEAMEADGADRPTAFGNKPLSGNPGVAYEAPASRHPGLGAHWGFRS
jgi:hypothetical protein